MKRLLTFSACLLFVVGVFAQDYEILTKYGTQNGGGIEVDLNNDGYLDLIIGGAARENIVTDPDGNEVEQERMSIVFLYNPETGSYKEFSRDLIVSDRAQFVCADFNGDGIMDIVAAESANKATDYGGGIYQGNGDGTFTKVEMTFDDAEYGFYPVAIDVADFNNDGLVDIVALGYRNMTDGSGVTRLINYNAVLINKGNYHFEVTQTELLQDYELALTFVKALDFNGDGYMDFFISSNCDNPNVANSGARVLADVFENAGSEEPGTFYRLFLGDGASGKIKMKANGGLDIADFNNDGLLDFVLHGEGGTGTGEPTGSDEWVNVSHMYLNDGSGSVTEKTQPQFLADMRPVNSTHNSTRTIDWNGNGHYDIIMGVFSTSMPDGEGATQTGFIFTNDGAGNMTRSRIPGTSDSVILFPDWNGDGVFDCFMSGWSEDRTYFTTEQEFRTAVVNYNPNSKAARPDAPQSVTASVRSSNVTLQWTPAATAMNNFSYEYYVKSSNGSFFTSCAAHTEGGELNGKRKALRLGNAMLNKSITLHNLPDGTYTAGVQAVNAGYEGSVFTTTTFVIGTGNSIDEQADSSVLVTVNGNQYNVSCAGEAKAEVYNTAGVLIAASEFTDNYTGNLNSGLYIVKVVAGNTSKTEKIVIR